LPNHGGLSSGPSIFFTITIRNNNIIWARASKRSSPTDRRNFHHRHRNDDGETDLGISVGICRVIGVWRGGAAGAHGIRNGNSDVIPDSVSGIIRDGDLKIHRRPARIETAQRFHWPVRSRRPRCSSPIVRTVLCLGYTPDSDHRYPGTGYVHRTDGSVKRILLLYCVLYNTNHYGGGGSHAHALA